MNHQVLTLIKQIIRVKFPWIKDIGSNWDDLVNKLGSYKPRLYSYAVKWILPEPVKMKCNTNRVAKGNPWQASYGFIVIRDDGTLIYAQAGKLGIKTNMVAEMLAILEVVRFCASRNYREVEIELDSLMMVNFIRKV